MLRAAFRQRIGPTERRKLIAAIHAQATALQLPDDVRREMQTKLVGIESTKDMTLAQLSTVWNRLTSLAHDAGLARRKPRRPGRDERLPAEPPTREQLDLHRHLYEHLHIAQRPMVVMAICRRVTKSDAAPDGHPWPQTREEANKLTEALKAMVARGWRPRHVEPEEVGTVETGCDA
ncbi:MAG: hypothetical protein NTAFB01_13200 [Nitrospira sp.]